MMLTATEMTLCSGIPIRLYHCKHIAILLYVLLQKFYNTVTYFQANVTVNASIAHFLDIFYSKATIR